MKQIGVGLIGFGTVGAGVADGLQRNRKVMAQRLGVDVVLKRIADVDIETDRGVTVDKSGNVYVTDIANNAIGTAATGDDSQVFTAAPVLTSLVSNDTNSHTSKTRFATAVTRCKIQ